MGRQDYTTAHASSCWDNIAHLFHVRIATGAADRCDREIQSDRRPRTGTTRHIYSTIARADMTDSCVTTESRVRTVTSLRKRLYVAMSLHLCAHCQTPFLKTAPNHKYCTDRACVAERQRHRRLDRNLRRRYRRNINALAIHEYGHVLPAAAVAAYANRAVVTISADANCLSLLYTSAVEAAVSAVRRAITDNEDVRNEHKPNVRDYVRC